MALFKFLLSCLVATSLAQTDKDSLKVEVKPARYNSVSEVKYNSGVAGLFSPSCEGKECWPETQYKREHGIVDREYGADGYECGDFWNPKPCEDARSVLGVSNQDYDII